MDILEDGELPSSPDDLEANSNVEQIGPSVHPVYTPLPRPQNAATTKTPLSNPNQGETIPECTELREHSRMATAHPISSSSSSDSSNDEDSDSDNQTKRQSGKRAKLFKPKHAKITMGGDGGADFKMAAAAYQNSLLANNGVLPTSGEITGFAKRKSSKNNVWGSILHEDALTSELTSIAVGRKSVKDLNSDRGAEVNIYIDNVKILGLRHHAYMRHFSHVLNCSV